MNHEAIFFKFQGFLIKMGNINTQKLIPTLSILLHPTSTNDCSKNIGDPNLTLPS